MLVAHTESGEFPAGALSFVDGRVLGAGDEHEHGAGWVGERIDRGAVDGAA